MSTNNNEYLNSIKSLNLNNIITNDKDPKINKFDTRSFYSLKDKPQEYGSLFKNLKNDNTLNVSIVNKKQKDVLTTIGDMKKKLSDSNNENKQFMDILSKNLQYYNTVVVNIIVKINQIFNLIKSLDITKGNPSIRQPEPRTEPPNRRGQNDELIKELVDTINKYLNEFNILKSNIDTVVGNNLILREELSKKSNDLFGNIKKLDGLFNEKFRELGIFSITIDLDGSNKLVTFKQIQNKMIEKGITKDNLNLGNDASFFYNFFFHLDGTPRTYTYNNTVSSNSGLTSYDIFQNILDNKPLVISNELQLGGSKRIKNRKTKRRKPKRKSVKRKKTKYFQTIL